MAGDDQRNRVVAAGGPGGAVGPWVAAAWRSRRRSGLAVWDPRHRVERPVPEPGGGQAQSTGTSKCSRRRSKYSSSSRRSSSSRFGDSSTRGDTNSARSSRTSSSVAGARGGWAAPAGPRRDRCGRPGACRRGSRPARRPRRPAHRAQPGEDALDGAIEVARSGVLRSIFSSCLSDSGFMRIHLSASEVPRGRCGERRPASSRVLWRCRRRTCRWRSAARPRCAAWEAGR